MRYIIIGHGGHGRVISDVILSNKENELIGFLDDKYSDIHVSENLYFGPIQSSKNMIETFNDIKFIFAIGNNHVRKTLVENLAIPEDYFTVAIHKTAVVSPSAKIGGGTVIMPNAVINANANVGEHVIINTGAVVEHDCKVNDFAHICPGVSITGGVQIGNGTKVGTGASIIPNIKVGDWTTIGAGASVICDIPSYSTAIGIPAKVKKQIEVN